MPDKDLINQIENPDLRIIAQILQKQTQILQEHSQKLDKLDKLDEIIREVRDIKSLMESELWHRELHLVRSSKVRPKGEIITVIKPDLVSSREKQADVVYIYKDKDGEVVARIVEAKGVVSGDVEEMKRDLQEKFENTKRKVVDKSGYKISRYEYYVAVPKYVDVPEVEGVKVVKVNPEVEDEDA